MNQLRVRLLGPFEVEGTDSRALGSRKARTLLKILALARGRPVSVDHLADCLWDGQLPARPSEQVAVLVSRLRGVLGAERLTRSDAGYVLAADWRDLDALGELAEQARRRLSARSFTMARAAAGAALALWRGPLLADEPEAPWAESERAAAERLVADVHHTAAEAALAAGDLADAAEAAQAALHHDPYDEAALGLLMAALAAAGRPASALAAYAKVRSRLAEDLGVDPAPATEAIHTAILLEQPVPGVVVGGAGAAPADGGGAGLPGRAAELAVLDAALERARVGLEIVVVEGEAGMGKTRLMTAWAARAAAAGVPVLSARCEELGRSLPLQVVVDAIDAHLHELDPERVAVVLGGEADILRPLLSPAVAGPARAQTSAATLADPGFAQAQLFAALGAVLRRVATPGIAVLALDDMHLASASTVEWLRFIEHRAADVPLLVVAAYRAEEGEPPPASTVLRLGPLDLEAAAQVVGGERAALLHERSGGNTLFLVELAAADPDDELPASIRQAAGGRCDRAGVAATTLRAAAIVGPNVDLDLLDSVLDLPPVELLAHLEEGVRRLILEERGSGFAFRHELLREALVADTSGARRALLHRRAGQVLAARPQSDPLEVAYHARLGNDDELAATALGRAAGLASARYDNTESERLLDEAVALHDAAGLRLQRARVCLMRQRYAEAADDAAAALRLGAGAPAFEAAAWAAYYQRDFAGTRRLADDGARLADDPQVRASCLAIGAWVGVADGDLGGAEARLTEAVALAHGPELAVSSSLWLGVLRAHQGQPDEALALMHPATLPEAAPTHAFVAPHAHFFTAYALGLAGRPVDALAALEALEAECARQQLTRFNGRPDNVRGWIFRSVGEHARADDSNVRGLEAASAIDMPEPQAHSHLDLADGCLQRGDLDKARDHLRRVRPLQEVAHAFRWRHQLRIRLLDGRLMLAAGETDEARAEAAALREDAEREGVGRYRVMARLLEARAGALAGDELDTDDLGALLERLHLVAGLEAWWLTAELAAAAGVDAWWGLADRHLARLAANSGPYADALTRNAGARLERMRISRR